MEEIKYTGCSSCGTGSCNKVNVFDWLADVPKTSFENYEFIELVFSDGIRKDFFYNHLKLNLKNGDLVVVQGVNGFDIGTVSLTGYLVEYQIKKKKADKKEIQNKKILRFPNGADLEKWKLKIQKEKEALIGSRAIIKSLNLEMKLSKVEMQADFKKATFYFIADNRVDFRELIKKLATSLSVKVEMKQIGVRQEASLVGGIGSCGKELCCSAWLKDFKSINTNVARYQNLSINQIKLSGQCGRLKCCLNYELDLYMEAITIFPKQATTIKTSFGVGKIIKKDIFKKNITYYFSDISVHRTLSIDQVIDILDKNAQNIFPSLGQVEKKEAQEINKRPAVINSEKANFGNVDSIKVPDLKKEKKKKKKNLNTGNNKNNPNANQHPKLNNNKPQTPKPPPHQNQYKNFNSQQQNQHKPSTTSNKTNTPK